MPKPLEFKHKQDILNEYDHCSIQFELAKEQPLFNIETNKESLPKLQEALEHLGFYLEIDDNELRLGTSTRSSQTASSSAETLAKTCTRNAGRKPKELYKDGTREPLRYSDVIQMISINPKSVVIEELRLTYMQFYRRFKKMESSEYYRRVYNELAIHERKQLDILRGIPGDKRF